MSLLQSVSYRDYKKVLALTNEQCERIARLADISISFSNTSKPGELLMKLLDRNGCTLQRFTQLISAIKVKTILTYYKPQSKVAILVANDKYIHMSKLVSPSIDCDSIGLKLQNLGFIVVTIKNTASYVLKEVLRRVCDSIPEDSYGLIFYAGHGCQLCNTKCLLGIDCPSENIQFEHCVTENFMLRELEKCKLDLCVSIMDMCRVHLDRDTNPQMYGAMALVEEYGIHKNLLISYSCQSAQAAYEVLEIECSTTIDTNVTYELKTGDTDKILSGASQYVNALCTRLCDDLDISTLLDRVHADVEHSSKKQKPLKIQCGVDKRSLYDPVRGDTASLLAKLQEVAKEFSDYCIVF